MSHGSPCIGTQAVALLGMERPVSPLGPKGTVGPASEGHWRYQKVIGDMIDEDIE